MRRIAMIALMLALPLTGTAQLSRPAGGTLSVSRQFSIYGSETAVLPQYLVAVANDPEFIWLKPSLLAVSGERIKQALLRELDATDSWRGKIVFYLRPARAVDAPVTIVAQKFRSGWNYRVEMPTLIRRDQYVRAIVQVLLAEMANRNARGSHSAEVPVWLAEGLAQQLINSSGVEFMLSAPMGQENGLTLARLASDKVRSNALSQAQHTLRTHPPLTFEQLSWPTADQFAGGNAEVYRSSAQLLVRQLLATDEGSARLRAMLDQLPGRMNWQFAFFDSFRPVFANALEVEKWWALQVVQFTGRDLAHTWSIEESVRKLDEVLFVPVQVRTRMDELPSQSSVSLQTVIREWNLIEQAAAFKRKQRELDLLRFRISQQLVVLLDEYRAVLQTYLEKRRFAGSFLPVRDRGALSDRTADETVYRLDALDAQLEAIRRSAATPVSTAAVP